MVLICRNQSAITAVATSGPAHCACASPLVSPSEERMFCLLSPCGAAASFYVWLQFRFSRWREEHESGGHFSASDSEDWGKNIEVNNTRLFLTPSPLHAHPRTVSTQTCL